MKRLSFILISLMLFLNSCSNDDTNTTNEDSLVGVWKLTEKKIDTPLNINNDGSPTVFLYQSTTGFLSNSEIIATNNTNGTIFFSAEESFSTRMENGITTFLKTSFTSDELTPIQMTYSLNNNIGTINYSGESYSLNLNGNNVSLIMSNGFVTRDVDTNEITNTQDLTYVFTRQ